MVSQIKVNEIIKQSGSSISIGESGDTLNLSNPTSVTLNSTMKNTPAFLASMTSNQTVANNTMTTVACNNEVVDSNGCYDTSTYKFTPTVAGYYFLSGSGRFDGSGGDNEYRMTIYKNTSQVSMVMTEWLSQEVQSIVSGVHFANGSSDYFQFRVIHNAGANSTFNGGTWESTGEIARFFGYKLIGV
jgi:hypothetical protein